MSEEEIPIYRNHKDETKSSPITPIDEKEWRRGDGEFSTRFPAVFPELPKPLKRIYVGVKNLNEGETGRAAMSASEMGLDRREKPAIIVGLKFSL